MSEIKELLAKIAQLEAERDEARATLRGYETAPVHIAAAVTGGLSREGKGSLDAQ